MCDHLNLTVQNLKQSQDWYEKVFGFTTVESGVYETEDGRKLPWAIIRRQNFMLCLYEDSHRKVMPESDSKFHQIFHFGLTIENLNEFQNHLENRFLIKSIYGPIRYPHSTSWYIKDPTGYEIEAVSWNQGEICFSS